MRKGVYSSLFSDGYRRNAGIDRKPKGDLGTKRNEYLLLCDLFSEHDAEDASFDDVYRRLLSKCPFPVPQGLFLRDECLLGSAEVPRRHHRVSWECMCNTKV